MGLILPLSSCKTTNPFPVVHPYKISLKNQACAEYEMATTTPITFKFVKWHPLADCEGFYGISAQDTAQIIKWYDEE